MLHCTKICTFLSALFSKLGTAKVYLYIYKAIILTVELFNQFSYKKILVVNTVLKVLFVKWVMQFWTRIDLLNSVKLSEDICLMFCNVACIFMLEINYYIYQVSKFMFSCISLHESISCESHEIRLSLGFFLLSLTLV